MTILETDRLRLRELDSAIDAEFIFELLNSPKFLAYIGDRGVRSISEAASFIDERYRESYRLNGFGLYLVELREKDSPTIPGPSGPAVGLCGFVKRDNLPGPDIGFAFLPEYEGKGYGTESARAMLEYGHETLGFSRVLAITTPDNDASGKLLIKLGFKFDRFVESDGESLKLFAADL